MLSRRLHQLIRLKVRSRVIASVVPADGKEIKEVRVNEEQMDLADGTVTFSMPEKDSLLQVILKEKEQAAEETEEPKQEVTQTEEWELPDEKEYQQRLQLAKALGMEDWLDEEGWLDDGYFAGKSDLELTESGVVPLIRNSITNPKMSRAVTLYNKITYNNISSAGCRAESWPFAWVRKDNPTSRDGNGNTNRDYKFRSKSCHVLWLHWTGCSTV